MSGPPRAQGRGIVRSMASTFGHLFRVTSFGESHGRAVGAVVDGCPPRVAIDPEAIQRELDRRRPGQSKLVSQRAEDDRVEILSGVRDGLSLGTPIALVVWNKDARAKDYGAIAQAYRPSHADFTYDAKYGIQAASGGGRASARETIARVAAGAIAAEVLGGIGVDVIGWVSQVGAVDAAVDIESVSRESVEATPVRCPDPEAAAAMIEAIQAARKSGDSLGGVVTAVAKNVPAGLGDPVFDKLEADLARAVMSIPACKGFEVGAGFAGTRMPGSTHNDPFYSEGGVIRTRTNHSGGIQGGISNGMPITCRSAFKPTATIMREQETVTADGQAAVLEPRGRHDPCVLPRAVPIVEAMIRLVLVDAWMRHRAQCG